MTDIKTILTNIGVTIPKEKTGEFDKAFAENYKTIAEVSKITTTRDSYREQLASATKALDNFKNVDIDDLNAQIVNLKNDLSKKDTDYQKKLPIWSLTPPLTVQSPQLVPKTQRRLRLCLTLTP